jgi:hypothetical protein
MIRSNFSQTLELPNLLNISSFGRIAGSGFPNQTHTSILFKLIKNRRSLPVFRGNFWACYECKFTSKSLGAMAMHIMTAHEPAPINDEEILEALEIEGLEV